MYIYVCAYIYIRVYIHICNVVDKNTTHCTCMENVQSGTYSYYALNNRAYCSLVIIIRLLWTGTEDGSTKQQGEIRLISNYSVRLCRKNYMSSLTYRIIEQVWEITTLSSQDELLKNRWNFLSINWRFLRVWRFNSVCVISWELVFVTMRVYVISVLTSVK
jgi:hypothetical protein